jgi:hypothetical protein
MGQGRRSRQRSERAPPLALRSQWPPGRCTSTLLNNWGRGGPGEPQRSDDVGEHRGSFGSPDQGKAALKMRRQKGNTPLGVRASFLTDPSRPDFPPRLPRKPQDGGRASQERQARPGHPAEGSCPLHRLPPRHPRHVGKGPCRARRSLLAGDSRLPRLRPPPGARGLWWADQVRRAARSLGRPAQCTALPGLSDNGPCPFA